MVLVACLWGVRSGCAASACGSGSERVTHVRSSQPVPANALWAIKGGAHAGRNVARVVRGEEPRPFTYRGLGQAASFGLGRSIAELYGVPLTGNIAWLLRLAFFLRFMPSRRQAVRAIGDFATAFGDRRPAAGDLLSPTRAAFSVAAKRQDRASRLGQLAEPGPGEAPGHAPERAARYRPTAIAADIARIAALL